jgi:exopolysaccharide biosynthesis polyprenyl glycosylphosphotransferase
MSVRRPWWDRHGRPAWVGRLGLGADIATDVALIGLAVAAGPINATIFAVVVALVTAGVGFGRGLYRSDPHVSPFDRGLILVEVLILALAAGIVATELLGAERSLTSVFGGWSLIVGALLTKRWLINAIDVLAWRRGLGVARVLFVGAAGESSRRLMQAVVNDPRLGSHLVGYVSSDSTDGPLPVATETRIVHADRLGDLDDFTTVARAHRVDEVIIVLGEDQLHLAGQLVERARKAGLVVRVAPNLEPGVGRAALDVISGIPVIGFDHAVMSQRGEATKRAVDFVLSVAVLAVAIVPMLVVALLIRLDSPGPALLRQPRVGRHGRQFGVLKFRTMVANADAMRDELIASDGDADPRLFKHADDPRLTRLGKWLRRFSLDECPQIWNVVRGEMSLVGPRPPLPEEVALYEPVHHQRLAVTPGLTGLWQVNGRSDLSFEEMIRLDLYYVETWSPWLDVKLLVRTIPAVIGGRGAY